jgi:hypothetical protein
MLVSDIIIVPVLRDGRGQEKRSRVSIVIKERGRGDGRAGE